MCEDMLSEVWAFLLYTVSDTDMTSLKASCFFDSQWKGAISEALDEVWAYAVFCWDMMAVKHMYSNQFFVEMVLILF